MEKEEFFRERGLEIAWKRKREKEMPDDQISCHCDEKGEKSTEREKRQMKI